MPRPKSLPPASSTTSPSATTTTTPHNLRRQKNVREEKNIVEHEQWDDRKAKQIIQVDCAKIDLHGVFELASEDNPWFRVVKLNDSLIYGGVDLGDFLEKIDNMPWHDKSIKGSVERLEKMLNEKVIVHLTFRTLTSGTTTTDGDAFVNAVAVIEEQPKAIPLPTSGGKPRTRHRNGESLAESKNIESHVSPPPMTTTTSPSEAPTPHLAPPPPHIVMRSSPSEIPFDMLLTVPATTVPTSSLPSSMHVSPPPSLEIYSSPLVPQLDMQENANHTTNMPVTEAFIMDEVLAEEGEPSLVLSAPLEPIKLSARKTNTPSTVDVLDDIDATVRHDRPRDHDVEVMDDIVIMAQTKEQQQQEEKMATLESDHLLAQLLSEPEPRTTRRSTRASSARLDNVSLPYIRPPRSAAVKSGLARIADIEFSSSAPPPSRKTLVKNGGDEYRAPQFLPQPPVLRPVASSTSSGHNEQIDLTVSDSDSEVVIEPPKEWLPGAIVSTPYGMGSIIRVNKGQDGVCKTICVGLHWDAFHATNLNLADAPGSVALRKQRDEEHDANRGASTRGKKKMRKGTKSKAVMKRDVDSNVQVPLKENTGVLSSEATTITEFKSDNAWGFPDDLSGEQEVKVSLPTVPDDLTMTEHDGADKVVVVTAAAAVEPVSTTYDSTPIPNENMFSTSLVACNTQILGRSHYFMEKSIEQEEIMVGFASPIPMVKSIDALLAPMDDDLVVASKPIESQVAVTTTTTTTVPIEPTMVLESNSPTVLPPSHPTTDSTPFPTTAATTAEDPTTTKTNASKTKTPPTPIPAKANRHWMPMVYITDLTCIKDVSNMETVSYTRKSIIATTSTPPIKKVTMTLNGGETARLYPGLHLNDGLVDFFLAHMLDRMPPEISSRIHVFNSHFFSSLRREYEKTDPHMSQLATWTRTVDVFSKDFLLVPVCQGLHWSLSVICFPWKLCGASKAMEPNFALRTVAPPQSSITDSFDVTDDAHAVKRPRRAVAATTTTTTTTTSTNVTNKNDDDDASTVISDGKESEPEKDGVKGEHNNNKKPRKSSTSNIKLDGNKKKKRGNGGGRSTTSKRRKRTTHDSTEEEEEEDDDADDDDDDDDNDSGDRTRTLTPRQRRRLSTSATPAIIIKMDSTKGHVTTSVAKMLRTWLTYKVWEYQPLSSRSADPSPLTSEHLAAFAPPLPLQENDCDCGIFLLYFAEKFLTQVSPAMNGPERIAITKSRFGKRWFDATDVTRERLRLIEVLKDIR